MFVTSASLVYTLYFGIISFIQLLIVIHSLEEKKKKTIFIILVNNVQSWLSTRPTNHLILRTHSDLDQPRIRHHSKAKIWYDFVPMWQGSPFASIMMFLFFSLLIVPFKKKIIIINNNACRFKWFSTLALMSNDSNWIGIYILVSHSVNL
jgi:hypothetical protein